MKHSTRIIAGLALLLCAGWLGQALQAAEETRPEAPRKIKAVVVTGGHGYDKKPFDAIFASFDDMTCDTFQLKKDSEIFDDVSQWSYDVIVLFNMTQKISDAQKKNLLALLDKGVGVVALHHCLGSYQDWPEYKAIIGCKYHLSKWVEEGVERPGSGYREGVDIKVHVEDDKHPITSGMTDFTVHDEVYNKQSFDAKNQVLLTTDHPQSDKSLAWVREYGKARVCAIQLGHGPGTFANPVYRRLVHRAIQWTARQPIRDLKTAAGARYEDNFLVVTFPEATCRALELKITGYYGASPGIRELGIYGPKEGAIIESQLGTVVNLPDGRKVVTTKRKQLENGAWIVTGEIN